MSSPTITPVIITLTEEDSGIRIRVADGSRVIFTRKTKWDANTVSRVESYLLRARIYRTEMYRADEDGVMIALGQYAGVAA
jgi:hypothetical protein